MPSGAIGAIGPIGPIESAMRTDDQNVDVDLRLVFKNCVDAGTETRVTVGQSASTPGPTLTTSGGTTARPGL